jgi:hypothetical protein
MVPLALGLLGAARLRPVTPAARIDAEAERSVAHAYRRPAAFPGSPSAAEAREGWWWWIEAKKAVNEESEALALAAIGTTAGDDVEAWRRWQMERDRRGHLGRARVAARRAASRAQTPKEAHEAALLLTRVECDAGRHQQELEQACRLMRLAPRDPVALNVVRRAARCNGLDLPVKEVR